VNEEQICDALWPDAQGDLAHRSFETTLYRLRQLIGREKAIQLSEGKLSLDTKSCWVDAFVLEQILNEAEKIWDACSFSQSDPRQETNMAKAVQLTQRAISMYKGHFLVADSEQLWMLSPRERLRAKYIRSIESLGGYWEACREWETAVKCYEKGLEVDDLAEEFYQHLMLCYQRLGRRAKVLAVYQRCRSVLETRLGLEPSARTQSLLDGFRSRR
jgi:DNA-binding SARP family transcriptional activator